MTIRVRPGGWRLLLPDLEIDARRPANAGKSGHSARVQVSESASPGSPATAHSEHDATQQTQPGSRRQLDADGERMDMPRATSTTREGLRRGGGSGPAGRIRESMTFSLDAL